MDMKKSRFAQCPDFLELERCLLPDDLVLVPRLVMSGITCRSRDGLSTSCERHGMRSRADAHPTHPSD